MRQNGDTLNYRDFDWQLWALRLTLLLILILVLWSCATELNWSCGPEGSCD